MSKLHLKEFRLKIGMQQREVAECLNVTQPHYHKLETGKSYPNSNQILRLCEVFKCSPNDIFGFHGEYKTILGQLDQD